MVLSKKTSPALREAAMCTTAASDSAEADKSPLSLGVITHYFPPDYAATGQLIDELVQQLGYKQAKPHVFTGQPGYAFDANAPIWEQDGSVIIRRSKSGRLFPKRIRGKALNGLSFAVRAFLHILRKPKRYQVLLVTTAPPFLPIVGYLANLLFGIPYVCLLYDLYPDIAVELEVVSGEHFLVRAWRWLNSKIWLRASAIIVLSSCMKQRVMQACPELDSEKVAVIHSWSNEKRIVPRPKAHNWFAMKHNLVKPYVVLYSGNMGRCHDINTIFDAATRLQDLDVKFVCIGDGAKREPLQEKVKQADMQNFLFLPYQSKSDLPYSLTACDLSLVSVSQGVEGLVAPSKLYSAMASGRPIAVVCPSHSYLKPLIASANCGATFENGDGEGLASYIRYLVENRQYSMELGRSGRQYMQTHFTPASIAEKYLAVLAAAAVKS